VLATIARQHQAAAVSAGSCAPTERVSSVDSALAALVDRLRLRLDVVVYRSAPARAAASRPVAPHAVCRFFAPHVVGAAAAAAARCTTLASACCSTGWGAPTANPPLKTPLDSILSPSAACVISPPFFPAEPPPSLSLHFLFTFPSLSLHFLFTFPSLNLFRRSLRFPLLPTAVEDRQEQEQQQQRKHAKSSSSLVSGAAAAVGGLLKPWLRGSK
jgi:hypothetical protein